MTDHTFDHAYWDQIWSGDRASAMRTSAPNPHLLAEVSDLAPGTALDAGCGAGAEAIWLAHHGWTVTAADIAPAALAAGRERAEAAGVSQQVDWLEADLSTWEPDVAYDLVTTHYAHPTIPQLAFYERIAGWVAPGGTLLIVGHLHPDQHDSGTHGHSHGDSHSHGDEGHPPAEASATAAGITALLDASAWHVVTARESQRTVTGPHGREKTLHDVVVRASRRATTTTTTTTTATTTTKDDV